LVWLIFRWLEKLLTVAATPFIHNRRCLTPQPAPQEAKREPSLFPTEIGGRRYRPVLEPAIEFVPRPRQWSATKPAETLLFYPGTDTLKAQRLKKKTSANIPIHRAHPKISPKRAPRPGVTRSADAFSAKYGSISAAPGSPFLGSAPGATLSLAVVRIVLTNIVPLFSGCRLSVYIVLVNTAGATSLLLFSGLPGAGVIPHAGEQLRRIEAPVGQAIMRPNPSSLRPQFHKAGNLDTCLKLPTLLTHYEARPKPRKSRFIPTLTPPCRSLGHKQPRG
jgi:hypothetical protein